jgi:hypothetical protein
MNLVQTQTQETEVIDYLLDINPAIADGSSTESQVRAAIKAGL